MGLLIFVLVAFVWPHTPPPPRLAGSGHLSAGTPRAAATPPGSAVPSAHPARDGVRGAVAWHDRGRPQTAARDHFRDGRLSRPVGRQGSHTGPRPGAGGHREGGAQRAASTQQPAGEPRDASGGRPPPYSSGPIWQPAGRAWPGYNGQVAVGQGERRLQSHCLGWVFFSPFCTIIIYSNVSPRVT